MDANFYTNLDALYEQGKGKEAEQYLNSCLSAARTENNFSDQITILNELIGFYRVQGNFTLCRQHCTSILELAQKLEIAGSFPYATILLNVANAYRVMGYYSESEEYFLQVQDIYAKTLNETDYHFASLYNNLSLLYQEQKNYEQAILALTKALKIIKTIPDAYIECGSTYTNLANIFLLTKQPEKALECLADATKIFEEHQATSDMHYSATLSAMAHAHYCSGNFNEALACYQKAADTIERTSGRTKNFATMYKNMANVYHQMNQPEEEAKALSVAQQVLDTFQ